VSGIRDPLLGLLDNLPPRSRESRRIAKKQSSQNQTFQEVYGSSGLLRFAMTTTSSNDSHWDSNNSKISLSRYEKILGEKIGEYRAQISSLLKRDFLIHGSTLRLLESLEQLLLYTELKKRWSYVSWREKACSDLKLGKLEEQIQALEQEVHHLRVSLVHSSKVFGRK